MKLTIDIRIAGCAARCWHCYVDGQPGPLMPLDEYRRCLDALTFVCDSLAQHEYSISLWLDYEPLLHPRISDILHMTKERFGDRFDVSTFPTSGIPVAARQDWESVLDALSAAGCKRMMFALYGPPHVHDAVMSRPGAYDHHALAVRRSHLRGFETPVKLIVSSEMLHHFADTIELARRNAYDHRRAVVPIYEPIARMRDFESHRATIEDVETFRQQLCDFCDDSSDKEYWANAHEYAERNVLKNVLADPSRYPSFAELEAQAPPWVFVTILPGLSVYYGNAGLYHRELGALSEASAGDIAESILALDPNYRFGGFYDIPSLPSPAAVAERFGDRGSGKLYDSQEDVFARWLDRKYDPSHV